MKLTSAERIGRSQLIPDVATGGQEARCLPAEGAHDVPATEAAS